MSQYVYKLTTPFGDSFHDGEGDVVQWPASLKWRCAFWWLLNPTVTVERTPFGSWVDGMPWKTVFRWPVRKIWS